MDRFDVPLQLHLIPEHESTYFNTTILSLGYFNDLAIKLFRDLHIPQRSASNIVVVSISLTSFPISLILASSNPINETCTPLYIIG